MSDQNKVDKSEAGNMKELASILTGGFVFGIV